MSFAVLQNRYLNTRPKKIALAFTSIFGLILVTPLCGFLFDCGCTWPWSGLDSRCNFHQQNTLPKCPWCASWLTGWLSVGVSIVLGVFVAVSPLPLVGHNVINESLLRIFLGTLIFLCVAILASELAAELQHYPLRIFANHQPDFRNWARNF
ncbi:MAG: hypothetical protein RIR39_187 [Pseudomonadota bacterium]|jgi:hypothetical protein